MTATGASVSFGRPEEETSMSMRRRFAIRALALSLPLALATPALAQDQSDLRRELERRGAQIVVSRFMWRITPSPKRARISSSRSSSVI